MAPSPGELALACELMLAEGCTPSIQVFLECLDAVFPIDLVVSTSSLKYCLIKFVVLH